MQDLRIVGVQAEGENPHLLLSDEAGAEYALPVDEALTSAVARASAAKNAAGSDSEAPARQMSPRDIQARVRAGATVDQVVSESGLSREHVLRYAGPVADERAFYASRARQTVVARASSAEQHRLAFGDSAATLEAMVAVRLRAMGVRVDSASWDAWRREDGLWAVSCDFDVSSSASQSESIGQQPPAEWIFDPAARTVRPGNEWAESLMSLPAAPASSRGRRLAPVEEPFDVDDHTPPAQTPSRSSARSAEASGQSGTDHENLLDILRARRGQRLGSDETGDDKLATLLTRDEQSGQRPMTDLRAVEQKTDHTGQLPGLEGDDAEAPDSEKADETSGTDAWGFSYEDSGDDDSEAPASDDSEGTEQVPPEPQQDRQQRPRKKKSSSRRPTMPRWDDILFGSKDS